MLDVGCGEGQVARHVARTVAGTEVVGVDPSVAQLVVAEERGEALATCGAPPTRCRLRTGSFDAAVACLVFEHITDVDGALAEVARVLRPGGVFLFLLNHPLLQVPGSGWIDDQILGSSTGGSARTWSRTSRSRSSRPAWCCRSCTGR